MKAFLFIIAILFAAPTFAQDKSCAVTGPDGYSGTYSPALHFECGSQVTPPPPPTCTPPAVLDPATNTCKTPIVTTCDAGQLSNPINGKTLKRQCSAGADILPGPIANVGSSDQQLATLLGGSWPTYNYSGYAPTLTIGSGYYVSLAFTPTTQSGFQLSANQSYGDGGTISVSTVPGSLSQGSPGFVCGMSRGATNGIYISTQGGVCTVKQGTTYYLNLADVDVSGNFLCYNGRANTCANSLVSYTFYAGQ